MKIINLQGLEIIFHIPPANPSFPELKAIFWLYLYPINLNFVDSLTLLQKKRKSNNEHDQNSRVPEKSLRQGLVCNYRVIKTPTN